VLRFEIIGGSDFSFGGIFVSKVGAGQGEKGVQVGDRLLAVNGNGLISTPKEDAEAMMKELPLEFDVLLLRLG
jgi:hypothetical protein